MPDPFIAVRRIYDEPDSADGNRVLVDRLWPRGISNERAHLDEWSKNLAPSTELRKWYGHDPAKFSEFSRRYRDELAQPDHAPALAALTELVAGGGRLTLLTGAKRADISDATVLRELLIESIRSGP
ncbi:DUF488 domain-containing protein [Gordonia sp. DT30]|uniref:DUF488 domain-containing protein n=1 Tax=Gordonia sp. DT30 TaxID=3416546 RepID=UPI003CE91E33